MSVRKLDINNVNVLNLAYLGDAIFEVKVREYLVRNKNYKVNDLKNISLDFVMAVNQAKIVKYLIDNKFLKDKEIEYVLKGRNTNIKSHPRKTDIITYRWATGFEVLFGYLYYISDNNRIDEIFNIIMEGYNDSLW